MRIPKIDRKMNGKIVKCEVFNDIGKSEETETLDINCKYRVRKIQCPEEFCNCANSNFTKI